MSDGVGAGCSDGDENCHADGARSHHISKDDKEKEVPVSSREFDLQLAFKPHADESSCLHSKRTCDLGFGTQPSRRVAVYSSVLRRERGADLIEPLDDSHASAHNVPVLNQSAFVSHVRHS